MQPSSPACNRDAPVRSLPALYLAAPNVFRGADALSVRAHRDAERGRGWPARTLARLVSGRLLFHEFRGTLLQFGRRDVLDMGADVPAVARRILHAAAAVAIEHVSRL